MTHSSEYVKRMIPPVSGLMNRLTRGDLAPLAAILFFALSVHAAFVINGFGEPDAARAANDAILWHHDAEYINTDAVDYRARVLPLWLLANRLLLDFGTAPDTLPVIHNTLNVVAGGLVLIPLFLIWRRLAGREIAYWGLLVVNLMPAFWLANIYGFPHLVGFTFCMFAFHAFIVAVDRKESPNTGVLVLSSFLLGCGLAIKADLILICGAPFGVLWVLKKVSARTVGASFLVPALGLLAPLLLFAAIADPHEEVFEFTTSWNQQFPAVLSAMSNSSNIRANLLSAGPPLTLLIICATGYFLISKEHRFFALFVVSWSLPVILFWGIRDGNSARHMMSAMVPLAIMIPLLAERFIGYRLLRGLVITLVLLANYVSTSPNPHSILPSTRLIESRYIFQATIEEWHAHANRLAESKERKLFAIGSWSNPYVLFAFLKRARAIKNGAELQIERYDGTSTVLAMAYEQDPVSARELALEKSAQGYHVISFQFDLQDIMSR